MNQKLLAAAREFKTYFLDRFPNVEGSVNLISDFNLALNEYAQGATGHGETITSITKLLSNPKLEAFAAADSQPDRNVTDQQTTDHQGNDEEATDVETRAAGEDKEIIGEASEVVSGDEDHDLAGLKELVSKLIADLASDN